jgi:Protein of unknown function (DUF3489)
MSSLSKSQRLVLTAAADRADGAILPLPEGLAVRGRARQLMFGGLIKRGLIAERPAREGEPAWSESGPEPGIALEITPAGRALIRSTSEEPPSHDDRPLEPGTARAAADAPEPDAASAEGPPVRPGTKQALLIDLLRRPDGATIAEIRQATGWQPHTVRAAITGLKKKGFGVTSAPRGDGPRAYRLTPKNTAPSENRG